MTYGSKLWTTRVGASKPKGRLQTYSLRSISALPGLVKEILFESAKPTITASIRGS